MASNLSFDYNYWHEQYHILAKSLGLLAEEHGTYSNKIRRLLIKLGITLKNKGEAQSSAISSGRHPHPTRGTRRPESTRASIGDGVSKNWKELSPAEHESRVERSKTQWENMSLAERDDLHTKAAQAVRKTSVHGSKLEKFLVENLALHGFPAEFHKTNLLLNIKMHLDIYIPSIYTAIEVDGPSHFLPIWGEEALQKTHTADQQKTALLTTSGYNIIRIKHMTKNVSQVYLRKILDKIVKACEYIQSRGVLPIEERLITIYD